MKTIICIKQKQMCEAFQKSLSAMTIRAQHLTQQLDNKQTVLDTIENQLKDKTLDYEDLSRKYQLLDNEYKKLQKLNTNLINNNIINENNSRTDSSMSNLSYGDSCHTDGSTRVKSRSTPSWLRGSTLRYFSLMNGILKMQIRCFEKEQG